MCSSRSRVSPRYNVRELIFGIENIIVVCSKTQAVVTLKYAAVCCPGRPFAVYPPAELDPCAPAVRSASSVAAQLQTPSSLPGAILAV